MRRAGAAALFLWSASVLGCPGLQPGVPSAPRFHVGEYQLVSRDRAERTLFDFTYRATCRNLGGSAATATAFLFSTSPHTEVRDGVLRCPVVERLASAPSLDTFTIRHDREQPFDPAALEWVVVSFGPAYLLEEERFDRTRFDFTYRVDFTNIGAEARQVSVQARSTSPQTAVIEGSVASPALPPMATVLSLDTFTLRHDRTSPFDPTEIEWELVQIRARDPDVNDDGVVDALDVTAASSCLGQDPAAVCECQMSDVDGDGDIDADDVLEVEAHLGESGFPVSPPDDVPPQIFVASPPDGAVLGSSPLAVAGTLSEPPFQVFVDGEEVAAGPVAPWNWDALVPLAPGLNKITVSALDLACNEGSASFEVTLETVDRTRPVVLLTVPSAVEADGTARITADASDDTGVVSVSFFVDGLLVRESPSEPHVLDYAVPDTPGTTLTVRAVARDAAGNEGEATARIDVVGSADDTPPEIRSLRAPPTVSPGEAFAVRAEVVDDRGVSEVRFSLGGGPPVADGSSPYEVVLQAPGDAPLGSILTVTAKALDGAGNSASASAQVGVVELADLEPPSGVTLQAPAEARPGQEVSLLATASDNVGVLKVVLLSDGVRIAEDPAAPYEFRTPIPPQQAVGSQIVWAARAFDFAGNQTGSGPAVTRIVAPDEGFVSGEVYDDTSGRAVEGATVRLLVAGDADLATPVETTTDARGRYVLEVPEGRAVLAITHPERTFAVRELEVSPGEVNEPLDARLVRVATGVDIDPLDGGEVALPDGSARLRVPVGAFPNETRVGLTELGGQSLPAPLPLGWSPRRAFHPTPGDTRVNAPVSLIASRLDLATGVVAARWDPEARRWVRIAATAGAQPSSVSVSLDRLAPIVFAQPDRLPSAPALPEVGAPFAPLMPPALPGTARVELLPSPRVLFLQPDARSRVVARAETSAPLPSGTRFQVSFQEIYDRVDASQLVPDPTTQDFLLYQRDSGFTSRFVAAPTRSFDAALLREGVIQLDAQPPAGPDGTGVVSESGGTVTTAGGIELSIPPAALRSPAPVSVSALDRVGELFAGESRFEVIAGVSIDLPAEGLDSAALLTVPIPIALDPTDSVLAIRPTSVAGVTRFEWIGLGAPSGGTITVGAGGAGLPLPGIRERGRILLVRIAEPLGFLTGAVDSGGAPPARALVENDALPFVSLVDADSPAYALAATLGDVTAIGEDLTNGRTAAASATLASAGETVTLDLSLGASRPRVVSLTPSDGASGVVTTTGVTARFSRPMDAATLDGQSFRLETDAGEVEGSVSLLADGATAVFRPALPLAEEVEHRVRLGVSVADRFGNPLLGNQPDESFLARFTTRDTTPPPRPDAGQITVSIPENGTSTITATQGTVEPDVTVSVVDETTGETTSVIARPDGSFELTFAATVDSKLALLVTDAAGNQTRLDELQIGGVGAAVVGAGGGTVRIESGESIEIPPGTFTGNTVVRIEPTEPFPVLLEGFTQLGVAVEIDIGDAVIPLPVRLRVRSPQIPSFDFALERWPFLIQKPVNIPENLKPGTDIRIIAESTRDDGDVIREQVLIPVVESDPDLSTREILFEGNNPIFSFRVPTRVKPGDQVDVEVFTGDADVVLSTPIPDGLVVGSQTYLAATRTVNGIDTFDIIDTSTVVVNPDGSRELRNNVGSFTLFAFTLGSAGAYHFANIFGNEDVVYSLAFGELSPGQLPPGNEVSDFVMGGASLVASVVARSLVADNFLNARLAGLLVRRGEPFNLSLTNTVNGNVIAEVSGQVAPDEPVTLYTVNVSGDQEGPHITKVLSCLEEPIAWNAPVDVEFSEPLDAFSANNTTVEIGTTPGGFNPLPVLTTFLNDNRRFMRIQPIPALVPTGSYAARLSTGVTDLAGNPLIVDYELPFQIRAPQTLPGVTQFPPSFKPFDMELVGNRLYVIGSNAIRFYDFDAGSETWQPMGFQEAFGPGTTGGALAAMLDVSFTGADNNQYSGDFLLSVAGGVEAFSSVRVWEITPNGLGLVDAMLITYPQSEIEKIRQQFGFYRFPDKATGIPKVFGVPRDIELIAPTAAYVATINTGIQSLNIPNIIGNGDAIPRRLAFGPTHPLNPGFYDASKLGQPPPPGYETCPKSPLGLTEDNVCSPGSTSIFDLALVKDKLVATGREPLTILDPSDLKSSFLQLPGASSGLRITPLENQVFDLDADGNTGTFEDNDGDPLTALDEIFDAALVGAGRAGLYVVDLSAHHPGTPKVIGRIQDPGIVSVFETYPFENATSLLLVDRSTGLHLIDFRVPCGIDGEPSCVPDVLTFDADQDGDGGDDRRVATIPNTNQNIIEARILPGEELAVLLTPGSLRTVRLKSGAGTCENNAPVADAGPDVTVPGSPAGTTTPLGLSAATSSDPEGKPLTFEWEQISGPGVTTSGTPLAIAGADTATPTIQIPFEIFTTDVVFRVRVGDGVLIRDDTVTVTVTPTP